jgi:hypothetical protein
MGAALLSFYPGLRRLAVEVLPVMFAAILNLELDAR